ncbi:MAG TPA: PEP/pyruvate-binding domain-containing protein, partial [Candidatus Tectomicrobia bacterium]
MADREAVDIQLLSTTAATDVRRAGGKGASLARLLQAGFPVPTGCVLSPTALSVFLAAHDLSVDSTPEKIQQALRRGTPPAVVTVALEHVLANLGSAPHGWAVRSSAIAEDSATASFAGMYESVLAVQPPELWSAIRHCWLSWWSEHALAYRQQVSATPATPALAVVLQHMVAARSAGVAFTAEPIHHDRTRMVINAAAGLGVAVVSGVVEPEQYTLAKGPPITLLERRLPHPGQPPLLSAALLDTLGALLQRLENFCGSPQDVEWAWDGSTVWILQSRPITTGRGESEPEDTDVWGNANLKDVMPGLVSPFTWSLLQPQLETAMREQWRRAGYTVPQTRPLVRRFWGRPYFNLTVFQEVASTLYGTTPLQQATQLGGAVIPYAMPAQPPSLWQRLRWLGNMLRFAGMADKAKKAAPAQFMRVEQVWRQTLQSVSQLDRASLLAAIERHATLGETFLLLHLRLTGAMSGNFSALRDLVKRSIPQAYAGLFADLVTGLGDVQSAEHSYRLWDLSRLARQSPQVLTFLSQKAWDNWQQSLAGTDFLQAWETFLNTYGHRALYEVEIANPRWREKPDYLFDILAAYVHLSEEQTPFQPTAPARRRQDAEHIAARHLGPFQRFWFRHILQQAQAFSRWRENSKSHLVMLIDMTRQFTLAAARFLIADGLID